MSRTEDAAAIRLRHLYRKRVLDGRPGRPLPEKAARSLVGPDCAYHLYRTFQPGTDPDTAEYPGAPRTS